VRYEKRLASIDLAGNHTRKLVVLPALSGLSRTYFVELNLESADGGSISRNVYWLSMQPDVLDWKHSNWYLTPVKRYADLTTLQSLPVATSRMSASTRRDGNDDVTTVTLMVPESSGAVALFQHLSIRQSAHGQPVLPVRWSDNDVTLWPGESLTLTARYAAQEARTPVVEINGWNVPSREISATAGNVAGAATDAPSH
jgi:exo-1,4-beta-D-glucosaminidase